MTYTIIGTGNMAWFLSQRLHEAGFVCKGIYGRDAEHAAKLANVIQSDVISDVQQLPESDVCILAVKDTVVAEIAGTLNLSSTVVIHTAGSVAVDVLPQADTGVLWFIFSINKSNLPDHRNIPAVYETRSVKAKEVLRQLAQAVTDMVSEVSWQQRQWLHLGAVLGNNFANHLFALCEQLCNEQGLPFSLLQPIIQQTLGNLNGASPQTTQTGPAIRGDRSTMDAHLRLLQEHPALQRIYEVLSTSIEDMYNKERN